MIVPITETLIHIFTAQNRHQNALLKGIMSNYLTWRRVYSKSHSGTFEVRFYCRWRSIFSQWSNPFEQILAHRCTLHLRRSNVRSPVDRWVASITQFRTRLGKISSIQAPNVYTENKTSDCLRWKHQSIIDSRYWTRPNSFRSRLFLVTVPTTNFTACINMYLHLGA